MDKIAIVIGATGLIGRSLVDNLVNDQHINKIITLTRTVAPHISDKVCNQVVDFDHLEDYAEFFNADLLFSSLGTTVKQAGSIESQKKVDLDYQFKAAKLAVENGVSHYLLVSSSGANEESQSEYLKMKGQLERRVKPLPFKRISIFQPSLLIGQRSDFRLAEKLGSWLMIPLCIIPHLRRFRPIRGEHVAAKMVQVSMMHGNNIESFRLDELFIKHHSNN